MVLNKTFSSSKWTCIFLCQVYDISLINQSSVRLPLTHFTPMFNFYPPPPSPPPPPPHPLKNRPPLKFQKKLNPWKMYHFKKFSSLLTNFRDFIPCRRFLIVISPLLPLLLFSETLSLKLCMILNPWLNQTC